MVAGELGQVRKNEVEYHAEPETQNWLIKRQNALFKTVSKKLALVKYS